MLYMLYILCYICKLGYVNMQKQCYLKRLCEFPIRNKQNVAIQRGRESWTAGPLEWRDRTCLSKPPLFTNNLFLICIRCANAVWNINQWPTRWASWWINSWTKTISQWILCYWMRWTGLLLKGFCRLDLLLDLYM